MTQIDIKSPDDTRDQTETPPWRGKPVWYVSEIENLRCKIRPIRTREQSHVNANVRRSTV